MTEKEDFIIHEPYTPSIEEIQAIKELEKKKQGLVANDWNSKKKHIKSFKNNLKHDMYNKQNQLCAFCRINVPLACVPMHCEHIVCKNEHPQWTFIPENLCVSCPRCNSYKGTIEVLVNPQTEIYPKESSAFKILHPLYDRYSDHIELLGGVLYRGKTAKGVFTIKTCHLYRVELAEERANQRMYKENKGGFIAELMQLATLSSQHVDNHEQFVQYVKSVVEKYKLSHSRDKIYEVM